MSAVLEIEDLSVDFVSEGRVTTRAVRGISLELSPGEALGVVGETGCGKTVTGPLDPADCCRGRRATSGRISLRRPRAALHCPSANWVRCAAAGISMVFQSPARASTRLPDRPPARESPQRHARARPQGESRPAASGCARSSCPIRSRDDAPVPARALRRDAAAGDDRDGAPEPAELLIADEPTTALDVTIQAQILTLMPRSLQRAHRFGGSCSSPTTSPGRASLRPCRSSSTPAGCRRDGAGAAAAREPRHPYTRGAARRSHASPRRPARRRSPASPSRPRPASRPAARLLRAARLAAAESRGRSAAACGRVSRDRDVACYARWKGRHAMSAASCTWRCLVRSSGPVRRHEPPVRRRRPRRHRARAGVRCTGSSASRARGSQRLRAAC